jgi:hypothetical protein
MLKSARTFVSTKYKHNSMTAFVIGINGGGTHTDLIAVSRDRQILARAEAGPANYHNIGIAAARDTLRTAIGELIRRSGQSQRDLIAIGAGLAGVDRPADHAQFEAIFGEICPGVPLDLENAAIRMQPANGRGLAVGGITPTRGAAIGSGNKSCWRSGARMMLSQGQQHSLAGCWCGLDCSRHWS